MDDLEQPCLPGGCWSTPSRGKVVRVPRIRPSYPCHVSDGRLSHSAGTRVTTFKSGSSSNEWSASSELTLNSERNLRKWRHQSATSLFGEERNRSMNFPVRWDGCWHWLDNKFISILRIILGEIPLQRRAEQIRWNRSRSRCNWNIQCSQLKQI